MTSIQVLSPLNSLTKLIDSSSSLPISDVELYKIDNKRQLLDSETVNSQLFTGLFITFQRNLGKQSQELHLLSIDILLDRQIHELSRCHRLWKLKNVNLLEPMCNTTL